MKAFKVSYKQAEETELIPVGEYEVFIQNFARDCTQGGTEYLSLHLQVRDDVEQEQGQKNRKIFESLWLTDKAMASTERKMSAISKCVGIPDDKEYDTFSDWGADIVGKFLRVKITHSKATDQYPARAQVSVYLKSNMPAPMGEITGYKEALNASAAVKQAGAGVVQVEDAELPF